MRENWVAPNAQAFKLIREMGGGGAIKMSFRRPVILGRQ